MTEATPGPLRDPAVHAVIERVRLPGRPRAGRPDVPAVPGHRRGPGGRVRDLAEPDYLAYVRDPGNGFLGMSLPLKGGSELSVRV